MALVVAASLACLEPIQEEAMNRIYVASSWRNDQQPGVVDRLREEGHEVYDFRHPRPGDDGFRWSEIDCAWEHWVPQQYRAALSHPIAEEGYKSDFDAMGWADTCVLVLPCGRSAHLEAGWFAGSGRRVLILLDESPEPELMYKMADSICLDLDEIVVRLADA